MKTTTTYIYLIALLTGAYAHGQAVFYRMLSTTNSEILTIQPEVMSWANSTLNTDFEIQASTGLGNQWQTVDAGTNKNETSVHILSKPTFPIPANASLVGINQCDLGDSYLEGSSSEIPVHTVQNRPFFMDRFEVTSSFVTEAFQWAFDNGLLYFTSDGVYNSLGDSRRLLAIGNSKSSISVSNDIFITKSNFDQKPVTGVTWYGALAFCNFRSAMEGLPSAINFTNWTCNFDIPGYRLPTELEWEKAARGNTVTQRFPWASNSTNLFDDIDGSMANYWVSGDIYENTNSFYLTPVGDFNDNPSSLNLFDLAGNVYEWCWDWYEYDWYTNTLAAQSNSKGPSNGISRVVRGGAWCDTPDLLRIAHRTSALPHSALPMIGFRCVRNF